jgi:hypothetical protein
MAKRDTKAPTTQPAEDMFGRPTSTRNEGAEGPSREAQGAQQLPENEGKAERKAQPHRDEDDEEEAQKERAYGGVGELPDGDGVRSDRGTNPLPSSYWAAYQDQKPETD